MPMPIIDGQERETSELPNKKTHGERSSSQYCANATECALRSQDRLGKACMSPAVQGKRRCRMHGGAPGSGAPKGNKNALKHGPSTREAIEQRRHLRASLQRSHSLVQKIKQTPLRQYNPFRQRLDDSGLGWWPTELSTKNWVRFAEVGARNSALHSIASNYIASFGARTHNRWWFPHPLFCCLFCGRTPGPRTCSLINIKQAPFA
jgi:hypothetical protein